MSEKDNFGTALPLSSDVAEDRNAVRFTASPALLHRTKKKRGLHRCNPLSFRASPTGFEPVLQP